MTGILRTAGSLVALGLFVTQVVAQEGSPATPFGYLPAGFTIERIEELAPAEAYPETTGVKSENPWRPVKSIRLSPDRQRYAWEYEGVSGEVLVLDGEAYSERLGKISDSDFSPDGRTHACKMAIGSTVRFMVDGELQTASGELTTGGMTTLRGFLANPNPKVAYSLGHSRPKQGIQYVIGDQVSELFGGISEFTLSPNREHWAYFGDKGKLNSQLVVDGQSMGGISRATKLIFSKDSSTFACVIWRREAKKEVCYLCYKNKMIRLDGALTVPELVMSPLGDRIAYIMKIRGQNHRVVVDGKVIGEYKKARKLTFSADGQHWAVITNQGPVECVIRDGSPDPSYPKIESKLIFSPDSAKLAYMARLDGLLFAMICDSKPGPAYPRILCEGCATGTHGQPAFSADSSILFYVAEMQSRTVEQILVCNNIEVLTARSGFGDTFIPSPIGKSLAIEADPDDVTWHLDSARKFIALTQNEEHSPYLETSFLSDGRMCSANESFFSLDDLALDLREWKSNGIKILPDIEDRYFTEAANGDVLLNVVVSGANREGHAQGWGSVYWLRVPKQTANQAIASNTATPARPSAPAPVRAGEAEAASVEAESVSAQDSSEPGAESQAEVLAVSKPTKYPFGAIADTLPGEEAATNLGHGVTAYALSQKLGKGRWARSQEGRHYAFACRDDAEQGWYLVVDGRIGKDRYRELHGLTFSDDGEQLGYFAKADSDKPLNLIVNGKKVREVKRGNEILFSPLGDRVFSRQEDQVFEDAAALDLFGGKLQEDTMKESLSFSSDGKHFAYGVYRDGKYCLGVDGRQVGGRYDSLPVLGNASSLALFTPDTNQFAFVHRDGTDGKARLCIGDDVGPGYDRIKTIYWDPLLDKPAFVATTENYDGGVLKASLHPSRPSLSRGKTPPGVVMVVDGQEKLCHANILGPYLSPDNRRCGVHIMDDTGKNLPALLGGAYQIPLAKSSVILDGKTILEKENEVFSPMAFSDDGTDVYFWSCPFTPYRGARRTTLYKNGQPVFNAMSFLGRNTSSLLDEGASAEDWFGPIGRFTITPDGKSVAFALVTEGDPKGGTDNIWCRVVTLQATAGGVKTAMGRPWLERSRIGKIIVSPNGRRAACSGYIPTGETTGKYGVVVDDLAILLEDGEVAADPLFSQDSEHVVFVAKQRNSSSRFVVLDGKSGQVYYEIVSSPAFSPDGRHMVYAAKDGGREYVVVDGEERAEFEEILGLEYDLQDAVSGYALQKDGSLVKFVIEYQDDGLPTPDLASVATSADNLYPQSAASSMRSSRSTRDAQRPGGDLRRRGSR